MPKHRVYMEPFAGNLAVMRYKRPAALNIGLDLDPAAPGLAWLATIAESGDVRSVLTESDAAAGQSSPDFPMLGQSLGAVISGGTRASLFPARGSTDPGVLLRPHNMTADERMAFLELALELASRVPVVSQDASRQPGPRAATADSAMCDRLDAASTTSRDSEAAAPSDSASPAGIVWRGEARDGVEFLRAYPFTGDELVYCDPPYLMSTRSGRRLYAWEWVTDQHRQFLRLVNTLPCMVMVSGYHSQLYIDELSGWNSIHFEAMTRGGHTATEWLWCNFPPPLELHDYRYLDLGQGFRGRERIGRMKKRWIAKLRKMHPHQRQAILAAIADIGVTGEAVPEAER